MPTPPVIARVFRNYVDAPRWVEWYTNNEGKKVPRAPAPNTLLTTPSRRLGARWIGVAATVAASCSTVTVSVALTLTAAATR
jgi:hypothetical protein